MNSQEQNISKARQLLFAMLSKLSSVDGRIEGDEINFVLDLLNCAAQDRADCIRAFSKARRSHRSLYDYADELAKLGLSEGQRREAYDKLWRVSVADRILRATEKFLLQEVCVRLQLPATIFEECYACYHPMFADEELNEGTREG